MQKVQFLTMPAGGTDHVATIFCDAQPLCRGVVTDPYLHRPKLSNFT